LVASIAHDINSQLTVITSAVQFLLDELQPDDSAQEDLKRIRAAGDRGARLARQLLALELNAKTQPPSLDLRELLHKMAAARGTMPGEQVLLQMHADQDLWRIRVDPDEMEHVIFNLVANAREAMAGADECGATGTPSVNVVNVELDGDSLRPLVRRVASGPYVMLAVSDTGPGMNDEIQKRVFEPFFTTKERGKGLGLGLATVLEVVKHYRGYLVCSSEVGRGSTFKVYLPRDECDATSPSEEPIPLATPSEADDDRSAASDPDDGTAARAVPGTLDRQTDE
jgi:signal transduction histidine kinase